jgi:hypothetical protein
MLLTTGCSVTMQVPLCLTSENGVTSGYPNYIQVLSSGLKSALPVHYNCKIRRYKSNIFPYWFFLFWSLLVPFYISFFFGAFAKLWKATVSFVVSVCASVRPPARMKQLGSLWTNFHEILYLGLNRKSVDKIQIWLKYDKNSRYFAWRRVHICDNISLK